MILLLSTLALTSAPQRKTSESGRCGLGKHFTTSRTFASQLCQITSKGPCFGRQLNPFCYMARRPGHSHVLDGPQLRYGGTR